MWVAAVCRGRGEGGLPGRAAADGVPHCEGRRLASRGGGRGREEDRRWGGGRWKWKMGGGTGIGGALLPKCQQASGETERETEVRGFGGRQAGRQADWREPRDSEISG